MVTTIKINHDGDIRRLSLEEVTYDAVVKMVIQSFPHISEEELEMKYEDEEGDMCTLVDLTFPDFVVVHADKKAYKIQVGKKSNKNLTATSVPCENKSDVTEPTPTPQVESKEESPTAGDGNNNDENNHGWGHWGHGGHWHGGCGGGLKWFKWIKALKDDGVLNPKMFASLFVQWLPFITQKVTRKLDMINHKVKEGLSTTLSSFLLLLQHHVETVPALQVYAAQIKGILEQEPNAPLLGDTLRSLLITLQGLAFEVQVNFMEQLSEAVLPLVDDIVADLPEAEQRPRETQSAIHHGVTCDHCGVHPIAGPRFKCKTCPNYDLCGNCFPQKMSIHPPTPSDASPHEFECIISPQWHGWKGHGKGWGKCGPKGFGKGAWLMPFLHGMMGGGGPMMGGNGGCPAPWGKGFKGWGKGWGKGPMNGQGGHCL